MTTDKNALETAIGYHFQNPERLVQALKHPSLDIGLMDNQRLEFLGDAVLGLLVGNYLFHHYPEQPEGQLDRMRANLINGRSLAQKAAELKLGTYLQVSKAQSKHHPSPSPAMLEDAFEALLGALYLDGGFEAARTFVEKVFADELARAGENVTHLAPKTQLQEWSQQHRNGARPEYALLRTEGPDHNRQYTVEVRIDSQAIAHGSGSSKKQAEAEAAEKALAVLQS
ncbi:MAG: ribonuclease III [Coraliomargaritaceae bacterium]